jgi:hypothetical protein
MQMALADWSPQELQQLATLFHRMVDDFLSYAIEDEEPPPGAGRGCPPGLIRRPARLGRAEGHRAGGGEGGRRV